VGCKGHWGFMIILVQFIERETISHEIYFMVGNGNKTNNLLHNGLWEYTSMIYNVMDYRLISPRNELRGYGIFRLMN